MTSEEPDEQSVVVGTFEIIRWRQQQTVGAEIERQPGLLHGIDNRCGRDFSVELPGFDAAGEHSADHCRPLSHADREALAGRPEQGDAVAALVEHMLAVMQEASQIDRAV